MRYLEFTLFIVTSLAFAGLFYLSAFSVGVL